MSRGASSKVVLVAFAARDGDPYPRDRRTGEFVSADHANPLTWGPALRLVADPRSQLFGRVSDFYYFCHPAAAPGPMRTHARTALEVAAETKRAFAQHIPLELRPELRAVTWKTEKPPNDHRDLFEFVKRQLREIRAGHPGAELVLQLSSGTSAMHAALLLACAVGVVDGPLRSVQSEREDGALSRGAAPFAEVDFELSTILQVARRTVSARLEGDAAPTLHYDQALSAALRAAVAEATAAARVRFPLLLRGERGVGKSSLARFIRAAGPFRRPAQDDRWPSVACGQFSDPARLNVELCGAKKGAYTGLHEDRTGLIELARDDTLFLDEIHDLSDQNQRALIRVIEEGIYYRMGDSVPRRSRFRLITGTNQPDEILRTRLSADFLDRIRDLEVEIPPLRACREDLPWMWRATCHAVARECGLEPKVFLGHDERVLRTLAHHPLPGNWRDLRRIAARMAVMVCAQGDLARPQLESILEGFSDHRVGDAPLRPHASEPRLHNGHAVHRFRSLEATLGKGLSAFWSGWSEGKAPRVVLEELLGDRYKAKRAGAFIRRAYPDRWAATLKSLD